MKRNLSWGLHWFRRDLRILGNNALTENLNRTKGKTLGIFCFDPLFLSRKDFSANRFAFFLNTLGELKREFENYGGELLIVDRSPIESFSILIEFLKIRNISLPKVFTWNRDYEPFALDRDRKISSLMNKEAIKTLDFRDHLVLEPWEVTKSDREKGFYQIYTPFSKQWLSLVMNIHKKERICSHKIQSDKDAGIHPSFKIKWSHLHDRGYFPFQDSLLSFQEKNSRKVTIEIPKSGFAEANKRLIQFKKRLNRYGQDRDYPSLDGTSGLSIFLKNGSITSSQIIAELDLLNLKNSSNPGKVQFLKEIIWREFYYSILYHKPEVETTSYQEKYRDLIWENNGEWFERWKVGQTGFPIVDAGMRQLNSCGWMHNRVRMIVASFLAKDLLIDWRMGELFFMNQLLDGDLASNNGGWQWAASTGCDPLPYFRIFNPWLQGKKFDERGEYIKKWIPELQAAPPETIHNPYADRRSWGYSSPMVEHQVQQKKALKLYHF